MKGLAFGLVAVAFVCLSSYLSSAPEGKDRTAGPQLATGPAMVTVEQTHYYDGNIHVSPTPPAIDVDADGTVAVAVNSTIGPGNKPNVHRRMVLVFDRTGESLGQIVSHPSIMQDVCFGPDGRVYTAEGWFGAGVHVYDRPGIKPRPVPQRLLKADGSDVELGSPSCVAVGPDHCVYTIISQPKSDRVKTARERELCITSPDNKLLKTIPGSGNDAVKVGPDGTVYSGDQVLQKDGTWTKWEYWVRDVGPDGRLLVSGRVGWGIYDPSKRRLDCRVTLPPGDWGPAALGPDGNVYLVPNHNPGLAYVVATTQGKILLRRGADFDRIKARLPAGTLAAGSTVTIGAEVERSRTLGYVPKSKQLPEDNRPVIQVTASLAPEISDPLGKPHWAAVALTPLKEGAFQLKAPEGLAGSYLLRVAATSTAIAGQSPLAVQSRVAIFPAGAHAFLVPGTDRHRTGFLAGEPIRVTVPVNPTADLDFNGAHLALSLGDQVVWQAPLGLGAVPANARRTAVVTIPGEATSRLRPGIYAATLKGLPANAFSGSAVVAIVGSVRPTLFQTPLHPYGNSYSDPVRDAQFHGELGATHVVSPGKWDGTYLDLLTRQGVTFHYQPYIHFSALNTLPEEHGALQPVIAGLAQRMKPYPAFRGFTYHDLQVQPWGDFGDAPRKPLYPSLWAKLVKPGEVPATVPEGGPKGNREYWRTHLAMLRMQNWVYEVLGDAIRCVDPKLDRTTMLWFAWLYTGSPDHLSASQTMISAHHMQEQYYHPVTQAYQADLWRRPGKPTWVYGNASWQEDGSGACLGREFMAALARGVQGIGRNGLPRAGDVADEMAYRHLPGFRLLHAYGGLSAVAEPDDQVAVWRSFYQEAFEGGGRQGFRSHFDHTMRAYTACLYAHRTAAIVTDDLVRAGALKKYKAVIVSFEMPLPPDLLAKVKEFQQGGGLVLANRPSEYDGYWAPEGAVELGRAFKESHVFGNFDTDTHVGIEADGRKDAAILLKALGGHVRPVVNCDDPTTWVSVLKSGKARYLCAVNVKRLPHPPMDLHRFSGYENTSLPAKTPLQLQPGDYVIYDVFAGRRLEPKLQNGKWIITADMSVFPGAVLALLPASIDRLLVSAGQAAESGALRLEVKLADAKGQPIDAAIPVEVTLTDARGGERYHLYRTAVRGLWEETLPVAANDSSGVWTITVTERLSGKQVSGKLRVSLPRLPEARPTPQVEWAAAERTTAALRSAKTIALVVEDKQAIPLAAAVKAVEKWLTREGKQVQRVAVKEYLADRTILGWDRFNNVTQLGNVGTLDVKLRARKYDLVVTFDTPSLPGGIVPPDILQIRPTATDPGPGRGLVQYAVMPVYDTEDAIALAGGDPNGLLAAAKALSAPPQTAVRHQVVVPVQPVESTRKTATVTGLREFIGVPISELAAIPDGQRIAVGMKGWGHNLFVLDADGKVLCSTNGGKLFPMQLQALDRGFAALEHENDPTTLYLKLHDGDGRPSLRLAAAGRRIGGLRDWVTTHPVILPAFLKQASFSVTPDGRWAAAAGSKGIALWDLAARKLVWRNDALHYDPPGPQNQRDPRDLADSFVQLKLSPDGQQLAIRHKGMVMVHGVKEGKHTQWALPHGATLGRVQVFDGRVLVVGDDEFFAFRDGLPLWHWKAPQAVTATVFAPDGLRYAIGEADGTLRLMKGGGQIGGWLSPGGAIGSLALSPDGRRVAFATLAGTIGVIDWTGRVLWRRNVGARAVIQFMGKDGDTLVGDWRGILRRLSATGKEVWAVDLTPSVWQADTAALLTADDRTPTLRLAAPDRPELKVPDDGRNLARSARIKFLRPKAWMGEDVSPVREVSLNDGKRESPPQGWFNQRTLELAAFVPSPPAWEFEWKEPVTLNTLVGYESAQHPEAVPEEVLIQAWVNGDWKTVSHEFWNHGFVHVHRFDVVTTTKLRYMPMGDLSKNVWLSELEVFNVPR